MDNPEEVLHSLDEFAKLKPKSIPRELEDYLMYVARTGDPVYQWPTVKILFREKLLNVITEFYESTPTLDLAPSPNVDPFNYESMKTVLLERLEAFSNAPFTVQRLCELLTTPRKEYNRPDKFMRAIEKNILVVSTREPGGGACRPDSALSEPIPNGVSEPPETQSTQSTSNINTTSGQESAPQTSSSSTLIEENQENHDASGSSQTIPSEGSNHVEPELPESSVKVGEEPEQSKQEEESCESAVKDGGESSEATDSSDSVTFSEVNSATEICEAVNVTSTDSVSNTVVGKLDQPAICMAESSDEHHIPTLSSSTEVSSVGEVTLEANESDALKLSVKESVSDSESKSEDEKLKDVPTESLTNKNEASSEALSEPSESVEDNSKIIDNTENETKEIQLIASESSVSSVKQDQSADSTALDVEEKEACSSEAVSSVSPAEVPTQEVVDTTENVEAKSEPSSTPDSSEAAPAVKKVESETKEAIEAVKSDVDSTITSTGNTDSTRSVEEAMEVDESSNQASAVDSEAMEVGDEEEPMELCEDNGLEEMTTSPPETTQ